MSDVQELGRSIEEELSAADQRRLAEDDPQRRAILDFQRRHEHYTTIADRVLEFIIRPRVRKLAEYFKHAQLAGGDDRRNDCCELHLHPTLQFPTTVTLGFTVSRDAQCQTLIVLSNFEICPVFFPFEGRERLTVPLGRVDDDTVAAWVDERLVHFVRTYLLVEAADQYDTKCLATDPVCGMQINPLYAVAQSEFDGQAYYFCREDCHHKFVRDPRQYLAGVDQPLPSRLASVPDET